MPQLNPTPWFCIFYLAWVLFLMILPIKLLFFIYPNELSAECLEHAISYHWTWPW